MIGEHAKHPIATLSVVDLLRIVAAASVMLFHYGTLGVESIDPRLVGVVDQSRVPTALTVWLDHGWIGVEIFFVISGYVIAMSAIGSTRHAFIRRRLLRLLPAIWICASITLACLLAVARYPAGIMLRQWLFSMTLFPIGDGIDPCYWTIAIEVSFYAVVAISIGKTGTPQALWRIAAALGFVGGVFWSGALANVWPANADTPGKLLLVQHGCFFALGMFIRLNVGRTPTPLVGCAFAIVLIECLAEILLHKSLIVRDGPAMALATAGAFLSSVVLLIGAPVLQSAFTSSRLRAMLSRAGKGTFPFYLLHQTFGSMLIGALTFSGLNGYLALLTTAVLVAALAHWISAQVEPGLRNYVAKRFMMPSRHPGHGRAPDNRPTAFPSGG